MQPIEPLHRLPIRITFNTPLEMPRRRPPPVAPATTCSDFQYSIGDAPACVRGANTDSTKASFNTPLEMQCRQGVFMIHRGKQLSILHWRCENRERKEENPPPIQAFNTPLEMHRGAGGGGRGENFRFQYSIGDADVRGVCENACEIRRRGLSILHWRCNDNE